MAYFNHNGDDHDPAFESYQEAAGALIFINIVRGNASANLVWRQDAKGRKRLLYSVGALSLYILYSYVAKPILILKMIKWKTNCSAVKGISDMISYPVLDVRFNQAHNT